MATSQINFYMFNPGEAAIVQYLEIFQLHCIVQDVKKKKCALLLTSVTSQTYAGIQDIVAPKAVSRLTRNRIEDILRQFHVPRVMSTTKATPKRLHNISKNNTNRCRFDLFMDEAMRTQLVYGIILRKRLLST